MMATAGVPTGHAVVYDPFAEGAIAQVAPTTEAQREIWLADRLGREASLAYNESVTIRLRGPLDAEALAMALEALASRHDALRATIGDDGLTLLVASEGRWPLERVDLEGLDPADREAHLARLRVEAVETPFDLAKGPLVRATLARLGAGSHDLLLTAHHVACDGWSFGVLATELMSLYAARLGEGPGLAEPVESFADHARALASPEAAALADADARWWVSAFEGGAPVLDLPTDGPRPPARTFASRREDLAIEPALVEALTRAGAREGASLFVTLFTAWAALLARLSGRDDVVVGVPAAGQAGAGKPGLVGHCVQLLPIRVEAPARQPLAESLRAVRGRVLDAYEHQGCTFGTLLAKLNLPRDPARLPLVSVLFNLDAAIRDDDLSKAGLAASLVSNPRHFENFELFLNASQSGGGLVLECQYNTGLYDAGTIRRWLFLYREALSRLAADAAISAARAFAPTGEDLACLARYNATRAEYERDTRIETLVARRVSIAPDAPAVTADGRTITYRELDGRANAVAHALRERGVKVGDLVGHCTGRSENLLVALLGILKSGAGYVPLDPAFPPDRLAFMLEDAGVRHLVADEEAGDVVRALGVDPVPAGTLAPRPDAPAPLGGVEDVAYVIYTSGSTGRPKGVRVPHRTVANLLASVAREPGLRAGESVLAVTTLSFDIAVSEVILPLVTGARIVMANRAQATDGEQLRALVERERIDLVDATPSTWRLLLAAGWRGSPSLRAICTGEPLPPDLGRELLPLVGELWNGYGPTETTVWSSFHRVRAIDGPVPIGRPVANTTFHVVDADRERVPVGVVGELWIGGEGVTLGYLDRPDLTAERFQPDPYAERPGATWYRTGDLGRWRADGVLECLGRVDHQVKVRGYRIEPGEIEATLLGHPSVSRTLVVAREDLPGDVRLVAYVVPGSSTPDAGALREHLRRKLPEYMVPAHVVTLERIPLLPNGKVDRKALPAPSGSRPADTAFEAPATDDELVVAAEMERVLALPGIGRDDNFFSLGGHSLLAARLASGLARALGRTLPLRAIFEAPTVRRLAAWREGDAAASSAGPAIPRRPERARAPLSAMQHRLWFLEQMEPGRATYNTPSAHRLLGDFDVAAFRRAFDEIVRRQPALRTVIEVVDGHPVQAILERIDTGLAELEDLSALPEATRETALRERLAALAAEPLDTGTAPLFRARLFRLGEREHVFYFAPHHIIWDGWSFDVLYREMAALYPAMRDGAASPLAELPVDYGDFAAWHNEAMGGAALEAQLAHWKARLAGPLEPLALPGDHGARPTEMSGRGGSEWVRLSPSLAESVRGLAKSAGTTPFAVLLAAYAALLHQLGGQREILVGVPVRGRPTEDLEQVMGLFVNVLPLRLRVDPARGFRQWVEAARDEIVDAFRHPDVPFDQLVRALGVPRDRSRFPVYQALFSFQDARQRERDWGGLRHDMVHVMQPGIAEDLSLWLMERPGGLEGGLGYNADLISAGTARCLRERFAHLVADFVAHPERAVGETPLAPAESAVLVEWNATDRSFGPLAPVHLQVAAQASRDPGRPAVEHRGHTVSYGELQARTEALAGALARLGAKPGTRVGLCLERSPDLVAAVLAVLRTGAAYVPLDPSYPADRLDLMAADAELAVVVADHAGRELAGLKRWPHLFLAEDAAAIAAGDAMPLPAAVDPADPAYVIYTSGSTGRPKGVVVPHGALANFLASLREEPGLAPSDRLLAVTTLSFDIAALELMLPLLVGARIVLADRDDALDPARLADLAARSGATVMQATPATWRILLSAGWRGSPGFRAFVGGEALAPDLARRLRPAVSALWNLYGPTETTVWSTIARIDDGDGPVTIGRPIANTQVHVLDEAMRPCAIGVPGELWIGGEGVATGYHGRPDLTADRFRADPFSSRPGARLYRTGDRGRWRADGRLEHLGRLDFQVKVRGYRIEPGEIEAALASQPAVAESVVVAREFGPDDVRLVAYCATRGRAPEAAALREHLRALLPPHMIPQHFVTLAAIPRLPNGKVDRASLPAPEAEAVAPSAPSPRAIATPTEERLAAIWRDLLKTAHVHPDDNFFDIGGHSLLAMQAILAMEKAVGKRIDRSRYIFESLGQIARAYDAAPSEPPPGKVGGLLRGLFGRKDR